MYYYVIGNNERQEIVTDSKIFNSLLNKKTCHKKFKFKQDAVRYLKSFCSYIDNEYNAFVDFEFTCTTKLKEFEYKNIQSEVLSIGICITNGQGLVVDTFYETVNPKYNKKLSKYCIELTHLTQEEIDKSDTLPNVLSRAIEFIKKYKIKTLNAYGTSDFLQTKTDIKRYSEAPNFQDMRKFVNKIKNIQPEVSFNLINTSLEISLEHCKILCGISGEVAHNALSDAIDLSKVLFASFYNPPSSKKTKNFIKLREQRQQYHQFRKIKNINYSLSKEEMDKVLDVCNILEQKNISQEVRVDSLIDDLLFLSSQEIRNLQKYDF